MQLTLIESKHVRLAKTYTPDQVTAYPLAKKFHSHEYFLPATIEGLRDKVTLLRQHAAQGHALLKGPLIRPLNDESRANLTDNNAPTQNIIIDIDGYELHSPHLQAPLNQEKITALCEHVIKLLPEDFQNVSYIVHASSSLGLKPGKVSLHLDFLLNEPIAPGVLKQWLVWLNLSIPEFKKQLDLTATGTALRYKLDVSLADNSRIIYIAPPIFTGIEDPVASADDRIFLVEKTKDNASIVTLVVPEKIKALTKTQLHKLTKTEIEELREAKGLPPSTAATTAYRFNDHLHQVVTNPDEVKLIFAYEKDTRVYYNINTGDSRAYYVYKHKPQVVWNFKGEPPFLFEFADPQTYEWHIDTFIRGNEEAETEFDPEPIVFNDLLTDTYYRGLLDRVHNRVLNIHPTHRTMLNNWMEQHNGISSEFVPTWTYAFDPTDPRAVDKKQKFINRYTPTQYMSQPIDINDRYKGLQYNNSLLLEEVCPNIFKLLRNVTGNIAPSESIELQHFLNWFAFIVCTKQKTGTAWLFHGTEGTGKGVLFEHIIRPILGNEYAVQIRLEDVDENFNAIFETALFVMIDEFKFSNAKNHQALMAKLRNYITEPTMTIRGMRQNSRSVRSFCNIILTGNDRDMMRPSDEDRRYNICPRQEIKLFKNFPELTNKLHLIDAELPTFASAMMHFNPSEEMARAALENNAKENLRNAARTNEEDFLRALATGDLDYLMDIMGYGLDSGIQDILMAAKNIMRGIIARYEPSEPDENGRTYHETVLFSEELLLLYRALVADKGMSTDAFGKKLARQGWELKKQRRGDVQKRGIAIRFTTNQIDEYKTQFLIPGGANVTPFPRS
jgi:Family of unknown function (DUF5906)